AGRTSDGNGSHASTLKSPSYTKSVSWQHYHFLRRNVAYVSILHHFRALHLFFPVYTLDIASNNRAQKPGTTFA
ncbi:hypothetical protein, partial [Citrobacter braakii]|uniref:hypothetical protein n=1 Tax=Citrobacter braakii TaxID=57706 RepID=UPI0037A00073